MQKKFTKNLKERFQRYVNVDSPTPSQYRIVAKTKPFKLVSVLLKKHLGVIKKDNTVQ